MLLAWASVLAPTLAFAAVGLLGSVALGRSPMGLLVPALLAFAAAGGAAAAAAGRRARRPAELRLPRLARAVHRPGPDRPARRRRRRQPRLGGGRHRRWPTGCSCAATSPTWRTTGPAAASRAAVLPLAALLAVTVGVVAAATPASGSGIDRPKLEGSLATAYAHLYRLQTGELHRPDVTEQQLRTSASCDKGGSLVADPDPATTGGASCRGTSPAPRPPARRSTSSTSPPTGGTSPTVTDRRRSTASSRSTPRRVTHPTPCGSSTALSTCSSPTSKG